MVIIISCFSVQHLSTISSSKSSLMSQTRSSSILTLLLNTLVTLAQTVWLKLIQFLQAMQTALQFRIVVGVQHGQHLLEGVRMAEKEFYPW